MYILISEGNIKCLSRVSKSGKNLILVTLLEFLSNLVRFLSCVPKNCRTFNFSILNISVQIGFLLVNLDICDKSLRMATMQM